MIWGELLWKTVSIVCWNIVFPSYMLSDASRHENLLNELWYTTLKLWQVPLHLNWNKAIRVIVGNNAERQNLSYCPILHFQIYCCIIIVSCKISFIMWKNKKVHYYIKTPLHVHQIEIVILDIQFLFSSFHGIKLPCERSPSVYKNF